MPLIAAYQVTLHSTARAEARARWEVRNQARLEARERCRYSAEDCDCRIPSTTGLPLRCEGGEGGGQCRLLVPDMISRDV